MQLSQFINESAEINGDPREWTKRLFSKIGAALTDEILVFTPKDSLDWAPRFTEMHEYDDIPTVPPTGLAFVTDSDQAWSIYKDGIKRVSMVSSYHGLEVQIDGNFVDSQLGE
jgi:hypothetical protein